MAEISRSVAPSSRGAPIASTQKWTHQFSTRSRYSSTTRSAPGCTKLGRAVPPGGRTRRTRRPRSRRSRPSGPTTRRSRALRRPRARSPSHGRTPPLRRRRAGDSHRPRAWRGRSRPDGERRQHRDGTGRQRGAVHDAGVELQRATAREHGTGAGIARRVVLDDAHGGDHRVQCGTPRPPTPRTPRGRLAGTPRDRGPSRRTTPIRRRARRRSARRCWSRALRGCRGGPAVAHPAAARRRQTEHRLDASRAVAAVQRRRPRPVAGAPRSTFGTRASRHAR